MCSKKADALPYLSAICMFFMKFCCENFCGNIFTMASHILIVSVTLLVVDDLVFNFLKGSTFSCLYVDLIFCSVPTPPGKSWKNNLGKCTFFYW